VLAVRAEPGEADSAAADDALDVHFPNVLAEVQGARMVDAVHREGFLIVIDGDIDGTPEGHFDAEAGATSAGEVVDDEFVGGEVDHLDCSARN
jgi:hypothetical protein